jgi:hypothetical protein
VSGQYVNEEGRGRYRGRGAPGLTREAREVTIVKGKLRLYWRSCEIVLEIVCLHPQYIIHAVTEWL